jgi:hypothetical protein
VKLNPNHVPEALRCLLPLAEKFGISDDRARTAVRFNPKGGIGEAKGGIRNVRPSAGRLARRPEAEGPEFSAEYIAFSATRMNLDALELHCDVHAIE